MPPLNPTIFSFLLANVQGSSVYSPPLALVPMQIPTAHPRHSCTQNLSTITAKPTVSPPPSSSTPDENIHEPEVRSFSVHGKASATDGFPPLYVEENQALLILFLIGGARFEELRKCAVNCLAVPLTLVPCTQFSLSISPNSPFASILHCTDDKPQFYAFVLLRALCAVCLRETNAKIRHPMDLSNITELSVSSPSESPLRYTALEWYRLLSSTRRLKLLGLDGALKADNREPGKNHHPTERISLAYLRFIKLEEYTWKEMHPLTHLFLLLTLPKHCAVALFFPSCATLDDPWSSGSALLKPWRGNLPHSTAFMDIDPASAPQVEISLRRRGGDTFATIGTVYEPADDTLFQSDAFRSSQSIPECLKPYSPPTTSCALHRPPPISVAFKSPCIQDIAMAAMLNRGIIASATSIRIIVDSRLLQDTSKSLLTLDVIPILLAYAQHTEALVLDEGAAFFLIPQLIDESETPGHLPLLPRLRYVAIQDSTIIPCDSRLRWSLARFAEWRQEAGLPVDVICPVQQDLQGPRGSSQVMRNKSKRCGIVAVRFV